MLSNSNTKASKSFQMLGNRFATDEEDARDIAKVVNESYAIECVVGGEHCFRKPGPKMTEEEVTLDH